MTKPTANDIDRQLGLRIKRGRQLAGLTAAALAEATNSTQQQISRYETGQNKISAAQLFLLANHLGLPVSWFFLEIEAQINTPENNEVRETPAPIYFANLLTPDRLSNIHLSDDTTNLLALWPNIKQPQRSALLRLMGSLVD